MRKILMNTYDVCSWCYIASVNSINVFCYIAPPSVVHLLFSNQGNQRWWRSSGCSWWPSRWGYRQGHCATTRLRHSSSRDSGIKDGKAERPLTHIHRFKTFSERSLPQNFLLSHRQLAGNSEIPIVIKNIFTFFYY